MQVSSLLFTDEANTLIAGTSSGELLVYRLAPLWSASFWSGGGSHSADPLRPSCRAPLHCGAVARLALSPSGVVLAAGREGLSEWRGGAAGVSVLRAGTRRGFNALAWDGQTESALVGCEDGTVLTAGKKEEEEKVFFEAPEGMAAVLDVAAGSSTVFVACAKGFVWAVDRESRAAVWRVNLRRGEIDTAFGDLSSSVGGFRASVVRVDPSGKWLLCGAGGASAKEAGFLSVWHAESREVIAVLPMRACPSGATWMRGTIVCCGAENALYQYNLKGELIASATTDALTELWDVASYHHADDVTGGAIAACGAGGTHILLVTAVGRTPIKLNLE